MYYKIVHIFALFFIGSYFSALQASVEGVTEVLYMRPAKSSDLTSLTADQIKTATLYVEGAEDKIEFISEKTKFKFDGKAVSFKEKPSDFLEKISILYQRVRETKVNKNSKFNHLCLTLYAVYKKPAVLGASETFEIVESPLFARKSKKYILDANGNLVMNPNRKVIFYTQTRVRDNDRWAYFTTQDGLASCVKKDPHVFPISTDSYECDGDECNVVCKQFFHTDGDTDCPHTTNDCRHTEPHALYHVVKHSKKLFSPLFDKAGNVDRIKSIGLRFFSYYQTCPSCIKLLSKVQQIKIAENKTFKLNYMFYFHHMYTSTPAIKIKIDEHTEKKIELFDCLFREFLEDNVIYENNPDVNEDPDNKRGDVKGYFKLAEEKDLKALSEADKSKIVSIYYMGLKRFRIYLLK